MAISSWILKPNVTPPVLVVAGGFVGAMVRASLDIAAKAWPYFPVALPFGLAWSTWVVNILGAFLLGALGAWTGIMVQRSLTQTDADGNPNPEYVEQAQRWTKGKLLVGTGFMGAFTTYGTWATGTVSGFSHGLANVLGITLVMLCFGLIAAGVGHFLVRELYVVFGQRDGS